MSNTPDPYRAESGAVSPAEERTMGTLAHAIPLIAMVVSAGVLGFVASLILYLIYKDRGPFARENAANSLNIQITTGLVLLVSIPLMLVLIGFLTFGIAILVAFVLHLIGALKAHRGKWGRPPLTLRIVQ